jgi:hypothetical protein
VLDPTNATTLYAWLAVGLAAVTVGLVSLLARGAKAVPRPWLVPVGLAGLSFAAAGWAAFAVAVPAAVPPALLGLVALALALFRTGAPRAVGAFLAERLGRPAVQSLGLVLLGVAVLSWQSWALTRSLDADLDDSDLHLSMMVPPSLEEYAVLTSHTDEGAPVPLWQLAPGDESDGAQELAYLRRADYHVKLIQTDGPDPRYNCHGWVFTGGRAWVRGGSVEQILKDNNYQPVAKPSAGDVAVYRQHGEVTHTAIVRGFTDDGTVLLESKWGKLGRYIHTADGHVYRAHACTYYTTARRGGHVLRTAKAD